MKNLRITGITLKQDRKIYLHCPWTAIPLLPFSTLQYSGKKVPILDQIGYVWAEYLDKDEIVISGDLAKELGVKAGDKINIELGVLGKTDTDYLMLYETNPKKFIKYLEQQSLDDKKKILKELLEYEKTNEEVVKWLDKNYSGLIREVGLE